MNKLLFVKIIVCFLTFLLVLGAFSALGTIYKKVNEKLEDGFVIGFKEKSEFANKNIAKIELTDEIKKDGTIRDKEISYEELRELSYMGANVLHEDTIFPVQELEIPIKDIYLCKVVSNYPDEGKRTTVIEYAFFVKKTKTTYMHIATGYNIPLLSEVADYPTEFAISSIRKFKDVFSALMLEEHLTNSSKVTVEFIKKLENDSNAQYAEHCNDKK